MPDSALVLQLRERIDTCHCIDSTQIEDSFCKANFYVSHFEPRGSFPIGGSTIQDPLVGRSRMNVEHSVRVGTSRVPSFLIRLYLNIENSSFFILESLPRIAMKSQQTVHAGHPIQ